MGALPFQEPSVPDARVEIPAELLRESPRPGAERRLESLKSDPPKFGQPASREPGLGGVFGATVLVLAILAGAFLLLRRFLGKTRLFAGGAAVRILARRPLAPRQEVVLVEIGSRVIIVGATRESLTRLGEITAAEELARLRSRCGLGREEMSVDAAPSPKSPEPEVLPAEPQATTGYQGVLEELSRIRTTVRDWARQEA
ncbi:MAG TPA: flagellar biosynthetic protein FliO [Planctomycetota bacterium]|nr:flagellar biosynthetic protein FliO [Planctomycetota bacterium]